MLLKQICSSWHHIRVYSLSNLPRVYQILCECLYHMIQKVQILKFYVDRFTVFVYFQPDLPTLTLCLLILFALRQTGAKSERGQSGLLHWTIWWCAPSCGMDLDLAVTGACVCFLFVPAIRVCNLGRRKEWSLVPVTSFCISLSFKDI